MLEKLLTQETYSLLAEWSLSFVKNAILAIVVYFVGSWLIKRLAKLFEKMLERGKVEKTLCSFLSSIVNVVLWLVLIIIIVSILGIETSSFVALFASAGVAIGMALSGTLQNFAGGVMILLFKPYKVGDFIEAQGYAGVVKEIQIFNTIIRTGDAQTVIIPNGTLSTGMMKNYSTEQYRRVDQVFQFAYGSNLDEVKTAVAEIQQRHPLILQGPVADSEVVAAPWTGVSSLGDSGVVLTSRVWCKSSDYWTVFFYMNETVYEELRQRGFMFPFNRMDVNIVNR
jgi:small conductance mechanosensitive channel